MFVKHEGKARPKVVIISESPAGFKHADWDCSNLNLWTERVLSEVKTFNECEQIGRVRKLGNFLACLTENRMVDDPKSRATVDCIYWTHAVKCFIQRPHQGVVRAKKRLGRQFGEARRSCREYLLREMEAVDPELVVTIGAAAYRAVIPTRKDLVGTSLHLPGELVFTYHPSSRVSPKLKDIGFRHARARVLEFLLSDDLQHRTDE